VRVRIEDAGPDGVGRVLLAGPVLARSYLGERAGIRDGISSEPRGGDDPLATGTTFFVAEDGVRWLRTSDLGSLDRTALRIHGRADDVIVTGGRKVAPSAVEGVLAGLPAVAEVVVVGVSDDEWGSRVTAAVVPADPTDPPSLDSVREAVAVVLGAAAAPRQLLILERLPLRGPGKPDRAAVAAMAHEVEGD
jgi:O-succinylbenzoic acid--CoA ligase